MKKYLRKITKILEEVIGTATVVSPELVINKRWNPSSDSTNNIMKVPSKNFYDYLGHYMCPDEALKDGEGNRGLGVGPYNNDLGFALDKRVFSSPGLVSLSNDSIEEVKELAQSDGKTNWSLDIGPVSSTAGVSAVDSRSKLQEPSSFASTSSYSGTYEWVGEWGDSVNGFETMVELVVSANITTDRVPGGITGDLIPTGGNYTVWIGNSQDAKKGTTYRGQNTVSFYNPYFSTGFIYGGNGTSHSRQYFVPIYRKPHEKSIIINGVVQARGGKYSFGLRAILEKNNPFKWLNFSFMGFKWDVGNQVWNEFLNIVADPLDQIFAIILGNNVPYTSSVSATVNIRKNTIATLDRGEIDKYQIKKNFGSTSSYHGFLYTQFFYPYFDQNPLYPYTDTFNYKKPFLENKVIENQFSSPYTNSAFYQTKKYKYFVPSLFCLLYETRIGVFYEQLAKQLKNETGYNPESNFNIKLEGHKTITNPANYKNEQEPCLYDIMYPTNEEHWNDYLQTTGWTDDAKADNTSFLSNFISGASVPAPIVSQPTFSDYEDVFTEYPFLPQNSISSIGDVIGDFQQIDGILKQDIGYDLNTWTALCNSNTTFKTLSSGEPKNLAFKIIEFILWYLEPNGIPDQTRLSVNSLLEFEKLLDEDVEDYTELNTDKNYRDYHIVGTKLYDRTCK